MGATIEELGEFLKQEPPRSVPRVIRKAGLKGSTWVAILFGFIFVGAGIPFLYIFFPWNLASEIQLDYGEIVTTKGTIQTMTETSMTMRSRHQRYGTPVSEVIFTFPVKNAAASQGQQLIQNGTCYITGALYQRVGRAKGNQTKRVLIQPGQRVTIEYLKRDPSICRVKGARLNPAGNFGIFIILFPILGFCLVYFSLRHRKMKMHLLKYGHFATGVVTDINPSGVRFNGEVQYAITVTFNPGDGDLTSTCNAPDRWVKDDERKMEGGENVGILYDPHKPQRMLITDSLIQ